MTTILRCLPFNVSMILFQLCFFSLISTAQTIDVQLLSIKERDSILINPVAGNYYLITGMDTLTKLSSNEVLRFTNAGLKINCKSLLSNVDTSLAQFRLVSLEPSGSVKLKNGNRSAETYTGNFELNLSKRLEPQLINTVNIDSYVSKVLIEEVGYNVPLEYLKIQAIISRTYAVKNIGRHQDDGFDLCSTVHCQVYHGKKEIPSIIHKATASSSGTVITDGNGAPILAAFHANCGGKTANSEHVWNNALPYLISVEDTFCLKQRSAVWIKELKLADMKKYLHEQTGMDPEQLDWTNFEANASRTAKHIELFGETFSLPLMRRDLGLRSTYFTITVNGDQVIFNGRGFGHGVGLCQQGAINMAKQDYNHIQILGFYFKNTRLEPISRSMLDK